MPEKTDGYLTRKINWQEHYYRTMLSGTVASWNVRDHHMADTLGGVVIHCRV